MAVTLGRVLLPINCIRGVLLPVNCKLPVNCIREGTTPSQLHGGILLIVNCIREGTPPSQLLVNCNREDTILYS
jgi:hypothetical protein